MTHIKDIQRESKIEDAKNKSNDYIRYMATGDLYEVEYYRVAFRVNIDLKTCGCGKWHLIGIPYNHDACIITKKG